ncbi:hypothetical protein MP228_003092 [Amoeboaphelidium protococcarum]|nr:hypothetical protein MP228_003092 [Amoeboaphelidium protococcarum]
MLKTIITTLLIVALSHAAPPNPSQAPHRGSRSSSTSKSLGKQPVSNSQQRLISESENLCVDEMRTVSVPTGENKYASKLLTCDRTTIVGTILQERSQIDNVYVEFRNKAYKVSFDADVKKALTPVRQNLSVGLPKPRGTDGADEMICEVRLDSNWSDLLNQIGCALIKGDIAVQQNEI